MNSGLIENINTKKFAFILSAVLIVISVIPVAFYYAFSGNGGSDAAIANNGVKLVKNLKLDQRPDVGYGLSSDIPNIRVNDMFLGTNNNLHKVIQIRLAQDGSYFILHQTKKISRYSNFRELVSDNFDNPKIENVLTFVENKRKIDYPELQVMFEEMHMASMQMRALRAEPAAVASEPIDDVQVAAAPAIAPTQSNVYVIDDVELATMLGQDSETTTELENQEFENAEIVEYVEVK